MAEENNNNGKYKKDEKESQHVEHINLVITFKSHGFTYKRLQVKKLIVILFQIEYY